MSSVYWVREDRLGDVMLQRQPWLLDVGITLVDLQTFISSRGSDYEIAAGNLEKKRAGRRDAGTCMWSRRNTLPLGNAPLLSLQRLLDSDLVLIRATMVDEFGSIYSEMQPDSDDYDGSIGASSRRTALFTTKVIDQLVAVAGRKAVLPQVSHLQL